jgi:hypothetical protein
MMKKFKRPLDLFGSGVLQCTFGDYPWDHWEKDALAAGVPKKLAGLGRLVVREAVQHDWSDELKSLCGWYDQGKRMIKFALRSPEKAERRWNRLLETDGLRGDYHPQTGEWTWGYLNPRPHARKEAQ